MLGGPEFHAAAVRYALDRVFLLYGVTQLNAICPGDTGLLQ